ncbi:MAG TPA: nucleotidyltransferase family protein [Gemmatimonadales bacterium]|jgi:dTDP-glucose pyrophosphorylase/CBS domain-containing protein|nr:nucleotidyltransferase family protein [Gemmatimonadales bacterium]
MTARVRKPDLNRLTVSADSSVLEALQAIEAGGEAITFVVDGGERVIGCLTDGDIRRAILRGASLEDRVLPQVMRRDFTAVTPEDGRAEVLDLMRARQIERIPVLDAEGRLTGLHTMRQLVSSAQRPNRAVILAGGKGTRLHPITEQVPKPMVTVAGRPILERLILHLVSCGLSRFSISINYLGHLIEEYFGDGSRLGCEIDYLRETVPLGTGGPLSLLPPPALPVVVLNGDLITQCDVGDLLDFHERGGYTATLGVRPYTVEVPFGVAEVEDDRLLSLREKPSERSLINAGIYVLSPEAIAAIPAGREYPITLLFETLLAEGKRVGAHLLEAEWLDVGRHDELRRARGVE